MLQSATILEFSAKPGQNLTKPSGKYLIRVRVESPA